ncbi:MAG: glycosyltransferase family 2 protein [Elusimicrobia bacterium]|nr:glycosyltransferase family 2 protein [Elusimicrobiota bacterium]
MKLSVIIPAYNEETTIVAVIEAARSVALPGGMSREILVINDGSSDRTAEVLRVFEGDPLVRVFHQEKNQGKTAAIKRGIREAVGEILLIQDADLEYSPVQYPQLLAPILSKTAEVVYGSRFLGHIEDMKAVNRWANNFSNMSFNLLFGTQITDINTCFKVFRAEHIQGMEIVSDHFSFETEITAKLVKKGVRILEVPIMYQARSQKQGKKIDWPRAISMYMAIIRFRFFN